jgi:hypothetical protein
MVNRFNEFNEQECFLLLELLDGASSTKYGRLGKVITSELAEEINNKYSDIKLIRVIAE